MTKLSQLISLPVFSIFEGNMEGIVENALINLDRNTIEFLIIYSEDDNLKKIIAFNDIYSLSESGIAIKNSSYINLSESMELKSCKCYNPINTFAFKTDGSMLGKVQDVEFTKNKVSGFVISNTTYPIKSILSFNDKLTLIKSTKNQRISNFKLQEIKANIMETKVSIFNSTPNIKDIIITPKKAVINYNFLLNRKVTKDISAPSGEVLLKKDAKISLSTINTAKQFGKIKELTLYSK